MRLRIRPIHLLLPLLGLLNAAVARGETVFSTGGSGPFAPTSGTVTFDTDAGTYAGAISGGGGRTVVQNGSIEVMVFDFTTVTIPAGVTVKAVGKRALGILATQKVTIAGTVDVNGEDSGALLLSKGGRGGVGGGGGGGGGNDGLQSNTVTTDVPKGGAGGLGGGGDGCTGGFNVPIILGSDGVGGIANGRRGENGAGGAGGGSDAGTPALDPSHLNAGGGGGGGWGGGNGGSYGLLTGCTGANGLGSGAGGGYGTVGGPGLRLNDNRTIPGGPTYGTDDLSVLQGGSGGGGGSTDTGYPPGHNGGGGGGGALMITSLVAIELTPTAVVSANGGTALGDPATNDAAFLAAGGSGSGGAIYLNAPVVTNVGTLCAKGGAAGKGGPFVSRGYCTAAYDANGGAGGGGRIVAFGSEDAGTCPGTGTTKVGPFRCLATSQCPPGFVCSSEHKCELIPIVDAGSDGQVDSGVDASTPDASDAGANPPDDNLGGGGCSCTSASSRSGDWFLLAVATAFMMTLIRRRR